MSSPCNCCMQPPCPAPILVGQAISASKTKPGSAANFTTQTSGCGDPTTNDAPQPIQYYQVTTLTVKTCDGLTIVGILVGDVWTLGNGTVLEGLHRLILTNTDPYTTGQLKTATVSALPAWPGVYGTLLTAFASLSSSEFSYSIRRIKWRLRHQPTGTCYLKVWPQKTFTPADGSAPTITPLDTYEWTGGPCIPAGYNPSDQSTWIQGPENEEDELSSNGSTAISIQKYSCVSGYTPPDDGSANGYPAPGGGGS